MENEKKEEIKIQKEGILDVRTLWIPITIIVAKLLNSYLRVPTDGDSIQYHTPLMVNFFQNGDFWLKESFCWFFPAFVEALSSLSILALRSDLLLNLQNIPFFVIYCLCIFSIVYDYSRSTELSVLAILIMLSLFSIFWELGNSKNDLAFTCFFLFFLICIFRYLDKGNKIYLFLAVFNLSVFPSFKYLSLGYSFLGSVTIIYAIIKTKKYNLFKGSILIFMIGTVFSPFPYYLRNYLISNSPLYPTDIKFLGYTIFDAQPKTIFYVDKPFLTSILANLHKPETTLYLMWNLLKQWGMIFIPVFFYLLINLKGFSKMIRKIKTKEKIVIFIIIASFLLYISTPFSAESKYGTLDLLKLGYTLRYAQITLSLLMIFMLLVLYKLKAKFYPIISTILISTNFLIWTIRSSSPKAYTRYSQFADIYLIIYLLAITFALSFVAYLLRNYLFKRLKYVSSIILMIFIFSIPFVAKYHIMQRAYIYSRYTISDSPPHPIIGWIDNHPELSPISVYGKRQYPFYGKDLKRKVLDFKPERINEYKAVVLSKKEDELWKTGKPPFYDHFRNLNWLIKYEDEWVIVFENPSFK